MSRRKRLIRNTVLACSVPVVVLGTWILARENAKEAAYVAGQETEGITRSLDRAVDSEAPPFRFTDVTSRIAVDFVHFPFERTSQLPEDMGPGAAWADYDGDGLFDLYLPNFAAPLGSPVTAGGQRLYRNRGDGTFEDVTRAAGLTGAHREIGAAWGDYDDDGDPDLLVTAWGDNVLWENRGDGTFRDVTERAGLLGAGFWTGASWSDPDLDGDLDLYVCGYVEYEEQDPASLTGLSGDFPFTLNPSSWPAHENRYWVNRGDGTFVERGEEAGVRGTNGKSLCAAWADFDADGWPDLYVANDVSDNAMYLNRRDGTFEDVSYAAVVADYRGAMGIAVGDWDGDLDLDLFVTHWIAQENALYSCQLSEFAVEEDPALLYVDDADRVGLGQVALDLIGWGTIFCDFDADGREDLFVANGSTFQQPDDPAHLVPMEPHLYWNRGAERGFFEVGEPCGVRADPPGVGRGAAVCDYDDDGDPDVLVSRHGASPRLLRNDTEGGYRVKLRVRGQTGHSSGLGARVLVYAGGAPHLYEAGCGPSYLSQSAPELYVGLGAADVVDSVTVAWPGGAPETWRALAAGRTWVLEEGRDAVALEWRGSAGRRTSDYSEHAVLADVSTELTRDEIRRFWEAKREADRHLRAEEWERAAAALERALALNPRHEDSLYQLGNTRLELGRPEAALESWKALLAVNPSAGRAWIQIGLLRATPGLATFDLDAAVTAFRRAHELNPEHSWPVVLWGEAELARGDLDAAAEVLASARAMNDQAASAHFLGGYIAWHRGDGQEAHNLLERARESLGPAPAPAGVLGEGDARTARVASLQRKAGGRGLFEECVQGLYDETRSADDVFALVDEARRHFGAAGPATN